MKTLKASAVLLIIILIAACGSNKTVVQEQEVQISPVDMAVQSAKDAEAAYADNDYEGAISKFNEAIGYYNEALPTATVADSIPVQIFRLKKNIALVHSKYASELVDMGDPDMALQEYETAIDLYKSLLPGATPEDKINESINSLYYNAAVVSRTLGESEKALNYYDLYLEANPDDEDVLLQKFDIYKNDLKDENKAFEVLKEYAINKNDFNACQRLGDLYQDKNDIPNAITWYEKALAIKTDPNVLKKLGNLYRSPSQQKWDKSNQALEQFITINPSIDELKTSYKLIGSNYDKLKNKAKAVEYFEKYSELEYDESICLYLASYYFDAKNNSKTLFWANKILENNPINSAALLFRGITRYNMNDMSGAKSDFELIRDDPKYGSTAKQYLKIIK